MSTYCFLQIFDSVQGDRMMRWDELSNFQEKSNWQIKWIRQTERCTTTSKRLRSKHKTGHISEFGNQGSISKSDDISLVHWRRTWNQSRNENSRLWKEYEEKYRTSTNLFREQRIENDVTKVFGVAEIKKTKFEKALYYGKMFELWSSWRTSWNNMLWMDLYCRMFTLNARTRGPSIRGNEEWR